MGLEKQGQRQVPVPTGVSQRRLEDGRVAQAHQVKEVVARPPDRPWDQ